MPRCYATRHVALYVMPAKAGELYRRRQKRQRIRYAAVEEKQPMFALDAASGSRA